MIDAVIAAIRAAKSEPAAKESLMENFQFSEKQAQAIVDMRLGRLSGLEREKIEAEFQELVLCASRISATCFQSRNWSTPSSRRK